MKGVYVNPPDKCNVCDGPFNGVMYDFRAFGGSWANGCQSCFDRLGGMLGTGCGQKYEFDGEHWRKVAG